MWKRLKETQGNSGMMDVVIILIMVVSLVQIVPLMVAHGCNPSNACIYGAGMLGLQVQGHPWIQSRFKGTVNCTVNPSFTNQGLRLKLSGRTFT